MSEKKIMNILTRNGIKLNWDIAYYGLVKKWLSPAQITEAAINNYFNEKIVEAIIVGLELKKNDEGEFIDFICELSLLRNKQLVVDIWQLVFFLEIAKSDKTLDEKINDIAVLWADLNYPGKWERFIYYMPNDGKIASKGDLFKSFINYLDEEKHRLLPGEA